MNTHLEVFDDKIPYSERTDIWYYSINSTFKLGWQDSDDPSKYELNLHSSWTQEQLQSINILPYIEKCISETKWFTSRNINKIIVNLVKSDDIHYIHAHQGQQVALYYVNMDWKDGWYGETIFYNPDNINDIVFTSPYIPGRIILFDGDIPHAIRPQSSKASKFRISLSLFFN